MLQQTWEQRKLGEVANIKTGSRNQQDSVTNGQYPFFIRSEKIEKLDTYDFDTEAILVPGDGRIGEIFTIIMVSLLFINAYIR